MNEEIDRLIASIYVSSSGVFDRHAVYKLCEEIERLDKRVDHDTEAISNLKDIVISQAEDIEHLQEQLDDITWKAGEEDDDTEEIERIREDVNRTCKNSTDGDEECKFLLTKIDVLLRKCINLWNYNERFLKEIGRLEKLNSELETENNNYKSMHVHPAIPTSGNAYVPSVFCPERNPKIYGKIEGGQISWQPEAPRDTPQTSPLTFISPIVSLDLDKVTEKPQREPEVDLP